MLKYTWRSWASTCCKAYDGTGDGQFTLGLSEWYGNKTSCQGMTKHETLNRIRKISRLDLTLRVRYQCYDTSTPRAIKTLLQNILPYASKSAWIRFPPPRPSSILKIRIHCTLEFPKLFQYPCNHWVSRSFSSRYQALIEPYERNRELISTVFKPGSIWGRHYLNQ